MDEIAIGSNEWIAAILDNEGWPEVLGIINPEEIEDKEVKALWTKAEELYDDLEDIFNELHKLLWV